MTLTAPVLEHARAVFVLAVGAAKRDPLERVWAAQGDVHATPARVVRDSRGTVTWVINQAAGGLSGWCRFVGGRALEPFDANETDLTDTKHRSFGGHGH